MNSKSKMSMQIAGMFASTDAYLARPPSGLASAHK